MNEIIINNRLIYICKYFHQLNNYTYIPPPESFDTRSAIDPSSFIRTFTPWTRLKSKRGIVQLNRIRGQNPIYLQQLHLLEFLHRTHCTL